MTASAWITPGAVDLMLAGQSFTSERTGRYWAGTARTPRSRPPVAAGRASLPLPDNHEDRVLDGRTMVFRPGDRVSLAAGPQGAGVMLLGGATLNGPRHIRWNFIASSKERIEAAKEAWRAGDREGFQSPPDDRDDFIQKD